MLRGVPRDSSPYMRPGERIRAGGRVRLQKRRRRPFDVVWSKREHHQQVDDDGKTYNSPVILLSFSRLRLRSVFVFLGRFRAHLQRVQPFLGEFLFQKRVHVSLSRHLFHANKSLGDDVYDEVRFRARVVLRRVPGVPGVLPRLVDDLQHRRLQRGGELATHRRRDGTADASHGRARGLGTPLAVGSDPNFWRRRRFQRV